MDVVDLDSPWEQNLALRKFPRYGDPSQAPPTRSPSPSGATSPAFSPKSSACQSGTDSSNDPLVPLSLADDIARRDGTGSQDSVESRRGLALDPIEEVDKETGSIGEASASIAAEGGLISITRKASIVEIRTKTEKLELSIDEIRKPRTEVCEKLRGDAMNELPPEEETERATGSQHHSLPEPTTYIFSPLFSTPGRKNTLLQRLFNNKSEVEVPDEIVIERPSVTSAGSPLDSGTREQNASKSSEMYGSMGRSLGAVGSGSESREETVTKETNREEVLEFIHLLHYPGSMHSDHVIPASALRQREPESNHNHHRNKAEQLMWKLFHLKSDEDRGREREKERSKLIREQALKHHQQLVAHLDGSGSESSAVPSPQDSRPSNTSGYFVPCSVNDNDIIGPPTSASAASPIEPARLPPSTESVSPTKSRTRPNRSQSTNSRLSSQKGQGKDGGSEEVHTTPSLFKDFLNTRHRRTASASATPALSNAPDSPSSPASTDAQASACITPNGNQVAPISSTTHSGTGTPTRQASMKLNRSQSDASMAEKYGRVSRNEVLGKGANATVRLAHKTSGPTATQQQPAETLYAVKEFRKRRRDETQREYIKKVIAEFCISSNMHHENVIQTVDLIQDERDRWCEVMEYMPGGDLYTLLSLGQLTDNDEILCYFKQLISGVEYLHSVGVAHRDLKPENLLLDAEWRVLKITDFGAAEVFRTCFEKVSRLTSGVHGSEPYIAPEEWTATSYDAPKTDVWACGIIFYTLLHTSIPWRVAKTSDQHFARYMGFFKGKVAVANAASAAPAHHASALLPVGSTPNSPSTNISRFTSPNATTNVSPAQSLSSIPNALQTPSNGTTSSSAISPQLRPTSPASDYLSPRTSVTAISRPIPPSPVASSRPSHGFAPFDRTNPALRNILYRMLDPDPAERWGIPEIVADDWFKSVNACNKVKSRHRHGQKDWVGPHT